jgi:hypothetical protein
VTTEESFDYPEGWKPKPGSVVKGPVTEVTTYSGGNFGAYPIVTIKTEAGEVAAHAFHTALRNQLAELNVQPGDEVAILYQGKKQKRDGSGSYESYRVKRLGQEGQKFDCRRSGSGPPKTRSRPTFRATPRACVTFTVRSRPERRPTFPSEQNEPEADCSHASGSLLQGDPSIGPSHAT